MADHVRGVEKEIGRKQAFMINTKGSSGGAGGHAISLALSGMRGPGEATGKSPYFRRACLGHSGVPIEFIGDTEGEKESKRKDCLRTRQGEQQQGRGGSRYLPSPEWKWVGAMRGKRGRAAVQVARQARRWDVQVEWRANIAAGEREQAIFHRHAMKWINLLRLPSMSGALPRLRNVRQAGRRQERSSARNRVDRNEGAA